MRDIIVMGAPKGGGAALAQVVSGFPPDLDASVFVALHVEPETPILLADVLNAPGRMRAAQAMHEEPIQRRRIYVAAQDKHLIIRRRRIFLLESGMEKPHRPSIDLLFASAAEAYRERVVGVLLLHAREDGAQGLHAIQKAGGRTVTQRNEHMPAEPRHPQTAEVLSHAHVELEGIAGQVLDYINGANDNGAPEGRKQA